MKEDVLKIEFIPVWDKWVWRIIYQNEDVLKRGEFYDEDLKTESVFDPSFIDECFYVRGTFDEHDDKINFCTTEEKAIIEEKVKAINEKYGIKKRWRAEKNDYYHYIEGFISIVEGIDLNFVEDNERYKVGNYFKSKELAEKYLNDLKKFNQKWHIENNI